MFDEILCVEEERQVGHDNCVSCRTLKLQIPESPMRPHFVKARVRVHLYPDGAHASFTGRAASAATTRRERSGMRKTPLKSAQRRRPCGHLDDTQHRSRPTTNDLSLARRPQGPQPEQKQTKPTIDAPPKPDNSIRYRQTMSLRVQRGSARPWRPDICWSG
jgi:hypothetical protein